MGKILALVLGISFCGQVIAGTPAVNNISVKSSQLDNELIVSYIGKLITTGCEQAVNDGSIDDVIDGTTQGMKKNLILMR